MLVIVDRPRDCGLWTGVIVDRLVIGKLVTCAQTPLLLGISRICRAYIRRK